ncbi:hypothetical protein AB7M49_006996 [Bradyrhizobium elkanii]
MSDLKEQLSPAEEIARAELAKAFRDTLATVAGKRVVFWVLEQCAMYRDAFSADNNVTNYSLGRQAAGRDVLAKLDEIDPRLYPALLLDMAGVREMDRAAAKATADNMENDDGDD